MHSELPAPGAVPNNLRAETTSFVGRTDELEQLRSLLLRDPVRLVTLSGPGGVGKTRLARQAAGLVRGYFPDGAFFVDFAPLTSAELVLPTIAQALGVSETGRQPLSLEISEKLKPKRLLLVLDNFEQVLDARAAVSQLLAAAPGVKILATSRELLNIYGEHNFPVSRLSVPNPSDFTTDNALEQLAAYEATRLFVERSRAANPRYTFTGQAAKAVATICRRLDGLPLALELAASRMRTMTPEMILQRLAQGLEFLTTGPLDLPPRQQTLRNTVAWSYALLSEKEQQLFRNLAVFSGGCTLLAIEAVHTEPNKPADSALLVESLLNKSLLFQEFGTDGEPRYRMLETIRDYACELLYESGTQEEVFARHSNYYLKLAQFPEAKVRAIGAEAVHQTLGQEADNFRAILERAVASNDLDSACFERVQRLEAGLRLGGALFEFWFTCSMYTEARKHLEGLREAAETMERNALCSGTFAKLADYPQLKSNLLYGLGVCLWYHGEFAAAIEAAEGALTIFRRTDNKCGMSKALHMLGILQRVQGNYDEAVALLDKGIELQMELGDEPGLSKAYSEMAAVAWSRGKPESAAELLEKSLRIDENLGHMEEYAAKLSNLGSVAWSQGNLARARTCYERSIAVLKELGVRNHYLSNALTNLGVVCRDERDFERARDLISESLQIQRKLEEKWGVAASYYNLGILALLEGDYTSALRLLRESLEMRYALGDRLAVAECLENLAAVVEAMGIDEQACSMWAAADAIREGLSAPLPAPDSARLEPYVVRARAKLARKRWDLAWAAGRQMSIAQAVTFASQPRMTTLSETPHLNKPASTPADRGSSARRSPRDRQPWGLRDREIQVLGLVARGLTNAQVAEELIISPHTVNMHLRSIYGKMGVTTRAAAVRLADEYDLL